MAEPDFQPTLADPLVTLRPLRQEDQAALFTAASDPGVWAGHTNRDRYKEEIFRPYFERAIASGSALAIIDTDTGTVIGTSRFHDHKADIREIEIGWTFLARQYWGGKYNLAAKRLMLTHAFGFVSTVVFWVAAENMISSKAMTNIGGVLRPGRYSKTDSSGTHPYLIFEITEASFRSGPMSV